MLTYSRFQDEEAAAGFRALLEQAGIRYRLEKEIAYPDKVYFGQTLDAVYALKLSPEDFPRMNALLAEQARKDLERPDPDYYLYSFSPTELKEVVDHPQEWNPYDVQLARLLYEKQGGGPLPDPPHQPEPVYKGERIQPYWLVLGYLAAIATIPAVFIGAGIRSARKTLPNGASVPLYDQQSRNHGTAIFMIGMFMTGRFVFRLIFGHE